MAGVITKFRIRAFAEGGPAPVTFRLVDISRPDPQNNEAALASGAGTGPTVTIPPSPGGGDVPILEFPGSLPVKEGPAPGDRRETSSSSSPLDD